MQPAFEEFNRASNRFTLSPVYADPVPDRAASLVREAASRGISARGIEARVEEILPSREFKHLPLIISVDNPEAIASALETAVLSERAVLIYFLIRLPNEELMGFRAVLQRGDEEHQKAGARFFRRLAQVTARSGSAAVLGAQGRPEHLALEVAYRQWFAEHMNANLTKIIAHTRPESDPFEVTTDGRTTMPLLMRESPDGWSDPSILARDVVEQPTDPIMRGHDFTVAEIGPDGIRFHVARMRALDGKPAIRAAAVVDPDAYQAADAERRERAERETQEALERAERLSVSRTQPVLTTD
ncbi:MAG TPA: hypothetical protein VGQ76_03300 [Thermoanaerobaculia bacterium]|jgi:hypothetical protein|nr:hypothetical protein [Thermoanaerobaculia bacterium]